MDLWGSGVEPMDFILRHHLQIQLWVWNYRHPGATDIRVGFYAYAAPLVDASAGPVVWCLLITEAVWGIALLKATPATLGQRKAEPRARRRGYVDSRPRAALAGVDEQPFVRSNAAS